MPFAYVSIIGLLFLVHCTTANLMFNDLEEPVPSTTLPPNFDCMETNALALFKACTYADQAHPCFKPSFYIRMNVRDIADTAILASQLCHNRVPKSYLRGNLCCFSPECLQNCYGI
ncbi:hypothetical protein M3Y98_00007000 [Aphelenchoides besseyi]|nr:hypothetical protein M3Y98_00007000 [Aphelenchoides besseyi]KAI6199118.1 hypothetical protein M3Y96_00592500 [Aphelenchoides besseyi]